MKTYWDLSEKERSELSEAGVEAFVSAELMTKGVLKVEAPAYEKEPDVALPPGRKLFRPSVATKEHYGSKATLNVAFEKEEQLRAFLALSPVVIDHRYVGGNYHDIAVPFVHGEGAELGLVEVRTEEQIDACRSAIEKTAAVREANRKKKSDYDRDAKAQKEVLDGLWADWLRCRSLAADMRRVADTFQTYTGTAGGDATVAMRFLRKVFSDARIIAAMHWCGFALPAEYIAADDDERLIPTDEERAIAESATGITLGG